MHHCPQCASAIEVARIRCPACGLVLSGGFRMPRLARLKPEQQQLVEALVLAAGNLKEMAAALDVSYPTLRRRLDNLIEAYRDLIAADDEAAQALLDDVAAGRRRPEEAARLIRELKGGL